MSALLSRMHVQIMHQPTKLMVANKAINLGLRVVVLVQGTLLNHIVVDYILDSFKLLVHKRYAIIVVIVVVVHFLFIVHVLLVVIIHVVHHK